jgi:hypothetical protein
MVVTLRSTTKVVELNGVPARVWEGETDTGIAVHAFITRVAVDRDDDASQFEAELHSCDVPSPAIQAYPARLIL